jgi:hypothetical protein
MCFSEEFDDPDDLWDFGTMRHVGGKGTVGRVAATPVAAPILEEEAYGHQPQPINGSSHSGGNSTPYTHHANGYSSSSTLTNLKAELPPVPHSALAHVGSTPNNVNKTLPTPTPSPAKASSYEDDEEGTVRMAERREASYGSDGSEELRLDLERARLASPVPPTMLESVVLPAIASVRAGFTPSIIPFWRKFCFHSYSLVSALLMHGLHYQIFVEHLSKRRRRSREWLMRLWTRWSIPSNMSRTYKTVGVRWRYKVFQDASETSVASKFEWHGPAFTFAWRA